MHWPRYSLRTVLFAVLGASLALGLWVESAERQRRAVADVERLHLAVLYDYQLDVSGRFVPGAKSAVPTTLLRLLGVDFFHRAVAIWMPGYCRIHDRDLQALRELPHVKSVLLPGARITDEGLKHFEELRELTYLNLGQTLVTDRGIDRLARLTSLRALSLDGTDVSQVGFNSLRCALPTCTIRWTPRTPPMSNEALGKFAMPGGRDFVSESARTLDKVEQVQFRDAVLALRDKKGHPLGSRLKAAQQLGRLRHVDGIPPLQDFIADVADKAAVRSACVQALSCIADQRVVPVLIATLRDPEAHVALAAHGQLRRIVPGGPKTHELLRADLTVDERNGLHQTWSAWWQQNGNSAELDWGSKRRQGN